MTKDNRDAMGIYVPLMDVVTRTELYSDKGFDLLLEWLDEAGFEIDKHLKIIEFLMYLRTYDD
jgi:hypothetical protein